MSIMKELNKLPSVIVITDSDLLCSLTDDDYKDIANDIEADFQISIEKSGLI